MGKDRINFKYHPNAWELGVFKKSDDEKFPVCECCEQKTQFYYQRMYCKKDINCICPQCIATGKASENFDGEFVQGGEDYKVSDEDKRIELYCKTPGYESWQGEYWLACCNDYCAYIGEVGTKELEEMGIADEVFAEYDSKNEYEDARKYLVKAGSMSGYLFRCLHCGKYHLGVDAD